MNSSNYPLVSIIVLNYNGKHHLKTCLDSLLKTGYPNFEVILVDNGSTDGSVEYVKENFPQVKVIALSKNFGFSPAMNIGIYFSRGEYIALLNNDIEVDPHWLKPLVLIMEKFREIGLVDCKYRNFFDRQRFDTVSAAGRLLDPLLNVYALGAGEIDLGRYDKRYLRLVGLTLFRRSVLEEVKIRKYEYFDSSYFFGYDDVDLSLRILLRGYKIVYVPLSVIFHKSSATVTDPKRRKLRPGIYYLTKKNQIKTILKNYEASTILKVLPLLAFELFTLLLFHAFSRDKQYTRELVAALTRLVKEMRIIKLKRSIVQNHIRKVSDDVIRKLMLPYPMKFKIYL